MNRGAIQTKSEIKALLADAGVSPRRRHGQHFLIDGNLMRRLLAAAEVTRDDAVLEVGPGTGALTEPLASVAGALIAVEIDEALCAIVRRRLAGAGHVTLIHGDVLTSKHRIAPAVANALRAAREGMAGRMMLVANLPYVVATPLIVDLLLEPCGFDRLCFTVQREVGDRLTARPGTRAYGIVSVLVQAVCTVRRLAVLPPQVFWPRPAVESAMYRLDVRATPFATRERLERFVQLVRAGFCCRRKMLKHNLARILGPQRRRLAIETVDLTRRAESLTVEEWIALSQGLD